MHKYETIACADFDGQVTREGQSVGHYRCFIKDSVSRCWIKTNDEKDPQEVDVQDVTKSSYVILLRKVK